MTVTAAQARPLLVAAGLAAGPAVALGLARFAYALVLPAMRTDLSLSFATAGALNTANAAGYLLGALVAAPLATRLGLRTGYLVGLVVTAAAVLASAGTGSVPVLAVLRLVAGAAGAVALVVGGGLAARAGRDASAGQATRLLAVYFCGGGAGILLSGLTVPPVLAVLGWRGAWVVLGVLAFAALAVAVPAARAVPAEDETAHRSAGGRLPLRPLLPLLVCYGLFGAGYIAYMTFIVAYLRAEGAGSGTVTAFWALLGAAATVAGFLWAPLLARLRAGRGVALVLAVLVLGAGLPLLPGGLPVAIVSAVPFGGAFLTVVTAVTAAARQHLAPRHWTAAIAALTTAFAAGQCVGPVLSGVLSDGPGGVRAGLALGAALLAVAIGVAVLFRDSSPRRS
ncbi:MFS transporter [Actinocatenispora thailandica]|uniref:MFS transporter n=1 Tax=Actinocatenispora thailandica TaxID=227318 RepID=A0A7R7HXA2_9ACTN|nr:YbfB/YjiJ family MFS transporter [Actinocatenispora thailandica]BCJ35511.1 MFS transporter [Actinocatenispora thailandica]